MVKSASRGSKLGLFIAYGNSFTGGPRVVVNLSDGLRDKGHELCVFTNRESEMTIELRRIGIPFKVIRANTIQNSSQGRVFLKLTQYPRALASLLATWRQVMMSCRSERIRVMWVRNLKGVLLAGIPARIVGCKLVWDIGMEYPARGIFFFLHSLGLFISNHVVAEAPSVFKKTFTRQQRQIFGRKLIVIKSAIPEERRKRIETAKKQQAACQIQDLEVPIVIIYPASIQPRKNQKLLVDAIQRLSTSHPEIVRRLECLFVGPIASQSYYDDLIRQLSELSFKNQCKFLGWRNDVPELLAESTLFCLLSSNEGVPYSVLEAMHAAIPIVASDAGGIPDVVESGKNGIVVSGESPDAVADAVRKVIEDPDLRLRISTAARAYAEKYHSRQGWLDNYSALLGLLGAPSRGQYAKDP